MMIAFCDRRAPEIASRRIWGNNYPRHKPPIFKNERRVTPSQKPFCGLPRMVNMAGVSWRYAVRIPMLAAHGNAHTPDRIKIPLSVQAFCRHQ